MSPPDRIATQHGAQPLRHVVQHECGHAAAAWALGYPFDWISLTGPAGPAMYPVDGDTVIMQGHDWVIKACGVIADQQARGQQMRGSQIARLILGGDSDIFEVDDATTGKVAVRPSRISAVRPGGDLNAMAAAFGAIPRDQAVPELMHFWRDCERFCAELRPVIDALAEVVLERGELSYADASVVAATGLAGRPVPVLADWLR